MRASDDGSRIKIDKLYKEKLFFSHLFFHCMIKFNLTKFKSSFLTEHPFFNCINPIVYKMKTTMYIIVLALTKVLDASMDSREGRPFHIFKRSSISIY